VIKIGGARPAPGAGSTRSTADGAHDVRVYGMGNASGGDRRWAARDQKARWCLLETLGYAEGRGHGRHQHEITALFRVFPLLWR
jgi:hypothetical protein